MNVADKTKFFCLNNVSIESDLRKIQRDFNLDLGPSHQDLAKDEIDYPKFPQNLREQASKMSQYYEIFYCLEVYIRTLIEERLKEENNLEWWKIYIPEEVRKGAEKRREDERAEGVTPRAESLMVYTNFGELGQIIEKNWDFFSDQFSDNLPALKRIMYRLNGLRGPIAHCGDLAEDEIVRLKLTMSDLFRLIA